MANSKQINIKRASKNINAGLEELDNEKQRLDEIVNKRIANLKKRFMLSDDHVSLGPLFALEKKIKNTKMTNFSGLKEMEKNIKQVSATIKSALEENISETRSEIESHLRIKGTVEKANNALNKTIQITKDKLINIKKGIENHINRIYGSDKKSPFEIKITTDQDDRDAQKWADDFVSKHNAENKINANDYSKDIVIRLAGQKPQESASIAEKNAYIDEKWFPAIEEIMEELNLTSNAHESVIHADFSGIAGGFFKQAFEEILSSRLERVKQEKSTAKDAKYVYKYATTHRVNKLEESVREGIDELFGESSLSKEAAYNNEENKNFAMLKELLLSGAPELDTKKLLNYYENYLNDRLEVLNQPTTAQGIKEGVVNKAHDIIKTTKETGQKVVTKVKGAARNIKEELTLEAGYLKAKIQNAIDNKKSISEKTKEISSALEGYMKTLSDKSQDIYKVDIQGYKNDLQTTLEEVSQFLYENQYIDQVYSDISGMDNINPQKVNTKKLIKEYTEEIKAEVLNNKNSSDKEDVLITIQQRLKNAYGQEIKSEYDKLSKNVILNGLTIINNSSKRVVTDISKTNDEYKYADANRINKIFDELEKDKEKLFSNTHAKEINIDELYGRYVDFLTKELLALKEPTKKQIFMENNREKLEKLEKLRVFKRLNELEQSVNKKQTENPIEAGDE